MKDFNEFLEILTDDESKIDIGQIITETAKEEIREDNGLPIYLYDLIDAVTDYKLRKYHEWVFGE